MTTTHDPGTAWTPTRFSNDRDLPGAHTDTPKPPSRTPSTTQPPRSQPRPARGLQITHQFVGFRLTEEEAARFLAGDYEYWRKGPMRPIHNVVVISGRDFELHHG